MPPGSVPLRLPNGLCAPTPSLWVVVGWEASRRREAGPSLWGPTRPGRPPFLHLEASLHLGFQFSCPLLPLQPRGAPQPRAHPALCTLPRLVTPLRRLPSGSPQLARASPLLQEPSDVPFFFTASTFSFPAHKASPSRKKNLLSSLSHPHLRILCRASVLGDPLCLLLSPYWGSFLLLNSV